MGPVSYSDGVVTIRSQRVSDVEADLSAKDEEQIKWLWEPGERERWTAMTREAQREHVLATLRVAHESFGSGPKWTFAVDTRDVEYVAYVDCDLANYRVPLGEANIAYSAHPAYRGMGYVSRAVRLILCFLRENTNAQEAHIIVDEKNVASLRVARAVGAVPVETWKSDEGQTMIRHVVQLKGQ